MLQNAETKYAELITKGAEAKRKLIIADKTNKEADIKTANKIDNEVEQTQDSIKPIIARLFELFGDTANKIATKLPVNKGDLIKALYKSGRFLADITKINQPNSNDSEDYILYTFRYKKLTDKHRKHNFGEFMTLWNRKDIEKVNNERKYLIENRPTHRSDFRQKVWNNADKETDKNGNVFTRDANVRKIKIYKGDPWDAGHKKDAKYSTLVDKYIQGDITHQEFLEEYHNVDNYQVENPHENRSHKHE